MGGCPGSSLNARAKPRAVSESWRAWNDFQATYQERKPVGGTWEVSLLRANRNTGAIALNLNNQKLRTPPNSLRLLSL